MNYLAHSRDSIKIKQQNAWVHSRSFLCYCWDTNSFDPPPSLLWHRCSCVWLSRRTPLREFAQRGRGAPRPQSPSVTNPESNVGEGWEDCCGSIFVSCQYWIVRRILSEVLAMFSSTLTHHLIKCSRWQSKLSLSGLNKFRIYQFWAELGHFCK